MQDLRPREMARHKTLHAFPRPATATSLTAATYRVQPETRNLLPETVYPPHVERHGMIVQPALDNMSQPTSRFTERTVRPLTQVLADLMERRPQALADAVAMDGEPAVCPRLGDHMGEAKKVERLRSALAPPCSSLGRVPAELNQTGFLGVEFQTKLGEAFLECFQTRLRLATVLKSHHKVIRVPHHNYISTAAILPPPFNP